MNSQTTGTIHHTGQTTRSKNIFRHPSFARSENWLFTNSGDASLYKKASVLITSHKSYRIVHVRWRHLYVDSSADVVIANTSTCFESHSAYVCYPKLLIHFLSHSIEPHYDGTETAKFSGWPVSDLYTIINCLAETIILQIAYNSSHWLGNVPMKTNLESKHPLLICEEKLYVK